MERKETEAYFPAISRYHNLQYLQLVFISKKPKIIELPELKKVRKLVITFKILDQNDIRDIWAVEIKNAPFLEVINFICVNKDGSLADEKLLLYCTGCGKLKFIKNGEDWLSKFEPGEGVLLIPDDIREEDDDDTCEYEVKNDVTHGNLVLPQKISYFTPQRSVLTMSPPLNVPEKIISVKAEQPWKCLIMTEDRVDVRNLIWAVYDRVDYNSDSRLLTFHEFVPPTGNQTQVIQTDSALVKNQWLQGIKDGDSVGILSGPVSSDAWCLLPMQSPLRVNSRQRPCLFEIASQPPSLLALLWHAESRRFYVRAIKPLDEAKLEVIYRYQADEHYTHFYEQAPELIAEKQALLPQELFHIVSREIKSIPNLQFLLDSGSSLTTKFSKLIHYCREFKQKALDYSESKTGTIDQFLLALREQRGVCEHRSLAFWILASYLGVKVVYIIGDNHARIELATSSGQRYQLDLNGGIPTTQIREEDRDPRLLIGPLLSELKKQPVTPAPALDFKGDPLHSLDYQLISYLVKPISLKKIEKLWSMSKVLKNKTPLIILPAHLTPLAAKFHLVNFIREQKGDFVYIDHPRDFARYLRPYFFDEKIQKKRQKSGPLQDLIEQGGTIIVNLTRFLPSELPGYQSLFDPEAQILGVPVSKDLVQVIGLGYQDIIQNDIFISRCQLYQFPSWTKIPETPLGHQPEGVWRIKNPANCQAEILIRVSLRQQSIQMENGWLLELISSRNSLSAPMSIKICNAPKNDREFEILCDQINHEGRFYFNGQWNKAAGLRLYPDFTSPALPDMKNLLTIITDNNTTPSKERIYLRANNIHECKSRLVIHQESGAYQMEGYLKNYDAGRQEFYLVQTLNFNQQYLLYDFIEEHKKPVTIHLAPGVCLGKDTGEIIQAYQDSISSASCRVTNDPDHDCEELLKKYKDYLIIPVSALTTYSELLALLKLEQKSDAALKFTYQPGLLLRTLKAGGGVIINGELPEFLFLELFSALVPQNPFLEINGERIALKPGQLLLVQPDLEKVRQRLIGKMAFAKICYPHQGDKNWEEFLHLLQWTPVTGVGNPPLQLTRQWLKLCRVALTLTHPNLHPHNPLKGLTAAHYLPQSVSYSWLNVLGKYYFRSEDTLPPRIYKLKELWAKHRIGNLEGFREHQWQLLNCFNGKQLHALLGDPLIQLVSLDSQTRAPVLAEKKLKFIYGELVSLLGSSQGLTERKLTAQFPKRLSQVWALLQRPLLSILSIVGLSGIGKTFFFEELKKNSRIQLYVGWNQLPRWLQDSSLTQTLKIWFLDEANMKQPGTYAFLRGMWTNTMTVVYDQKKYPLTPQHKVIVVGNPGYFPNRYEHEEFLQCETLIFKMPGEVELVQLLKNTGLQNFLLKHLVAVFLKVIEINVQGAYSLRDLIDSAERFKFMEAYHKGKPLEKIFFDTCQSAYAYGIRDAIVRESFTQWLISRIGRDYRESTGSLVSVSLNGHSLQIPSEYLPVLNSISFMLMMRKEALKTGRSGNYKRGILVEGPPGVGKSTWFEVCCQQAGLIAGVLGLDSLEQKTTAAKRKRKYEFSSQNHSVYYKVSAGTEVLTAGLKQISREEGVGIIEELNELNSHEEQELNELLSGVGENKGRCLLLASKNPAGKKNNTSLSEATLSRMQKMIVNEPSPEALLRISERALGYSLGKKMTSAFFRFRQDHEATNTRHFFQMLAFKKSTGKEKQSLFREVFVQALKNYRASLHPQPLLWVESVRNKWKKKP